MRNCTATVQLDWQKIERIFESLDNSHLPGAAVGIALGGRPVYRKGFGLASLELPVTLSPTIRMRIGSVTKQFTALAFMLLCEERRAHLDDRVSTVLPELHSVTHHITMRQLMGNVSGLRDVHDITWTFDGISADVTHRDLLNLYHYIDDVNSAPGTTFSYNNGGWVILGAAIERITSQSLEDVLRERVFDPLGMSDTLLRRRDTDFVPNSAALHAARATSEQARKCHGGSLQSPVESQSGFDRAYFHTELGGEGGMVSTVDDMLRWLANIRRPTVGTARTWEVMTTPQTLANGSSTGYGLGLITDEYRGSTILYHPGGVRGGNVQILRVPAADLDIVVLLNRDDVFAPVLAERILDACLPGEASPERALGAIATGTFQSPVSGRVIQLLAEGNQQLASIGGNDMPVTADERGVLRPIGLYRYEKLSLTRVGSESSPAEIRLVEFGNPDELRRMDPPGTPHAFDIVGRFRSEAIRCELMISESEDGPQLTASGQFGSVVYGLECLADGVWRARSTGIYPPGGILRFHHDMATMHFDTFRSRSLPFTRTE
jgi:D-aminopeptidase